MAISFDQQYYVEKARNSKFEWLLFAFSILTLVVHGVFFHWIPKYLRARRDPQSLKNVGYFKFLKYWDLWTNCFRFSIGSVSFYYQPSVVLLGIVYLAIMGVFCFVQTIDLNYEARSYIVAKRVSAVAMGNLPTLMLMIAKNDVLSSISGLQHDRITFIHKWVARAMWAMITTHLIMACKYWIDLDVILMIFIPPQYFGMIAYGSFCILTWGSLKFLRGWSFEIFLGLHRVFSFIMLIMVIFHSPPTRVIVIIAVHCVVLDRVVSRIIGLIHKYKSPTKGISEFEILDENTMAVTIPIRDIEFEFPQKWYNTFLPKCRVWKAGQHIFINIGSVNAMQYHPFTICSLSDSGKMRLLIRKQKGFTKNLMKKLYNMQEAIDNPDRIVVQSRLAKALKVPETYVKSLVQKYITKAPQQEQNVFDDIISNSSNALKMKVTFHGPYGAQYQPFTSFDYSLFIGAGSGASFTFPVALDLLRNIKARDEAGDFLHRPQSALVHIVWIIRKEENIVWFQDLVDEIMTYVSAQRAKLDIYITQQVEQSEQSEPAFETKETLEKDVTSKFANSFSTSSSSISAGASSVSCKYYCRPHIADIVNESARSIGYDCTGTYKSLSVAACGPDTLMDVIKVECQHIRRSPKSPDIYCYTEAF